MIYLLVLTLFLTGPGVYGPYMDDATVPADTNRTADPPDDPPEDPPDDPPDDPPEDPPDDPPDDPPEDPPEDPEDIYHDPRDDRPMTPEELRALRGEEEDPEEHEPVEPLIMAVPAAYRQITSDSLSRWELWSDHGEFVSRRPGVIAFQLGGQGRNDGFLILAHESRHQRIYRNGIPVNERIFGSSNRNRLPHYSRMASVYEFSASTRYRSDVTLQRYHVTRPLTFVNYEQTTHSYRSTEGYLTRNISPSTNLSIGYWGKNEDESYQNNEMGGRNAEFTAYHFLNDRLLLEGGFFYSGLQFGEPGGYQIVDMNTFSFDRFEAFAREPQAESSVRNSLFHVTAYYRDDPESEANSRLSLYHDRYRRFHYDASDSSNIRTLTYGMSGRHIRYLGPFELQGDLLAEWSVIGRDRFQTMDIDSWIYGEGKGMATLPLPNRSHLHTWIQAGWRNDGFADFEIGSKINWRLIGGFEVHGSYAIGEQMPHPGQIYWRRPMAGGNTGLQNEVIRRAEAGVIFRSGDWIVGGQIYGSAYERPVLVGQDSTFLQAGGYQSVGATGYMTYDGARLELSLSGTFQQYLSDSPRIENQLLDRSGQRVWTRASVYYKNYVFDRAAFIKSGFYLQASPVWYRSSEYYPAMDYWDPNSWLRTNDVFEAQAIPEFVRLDLDLTARVRSVIFLFRMENALDNWLLPGYFETAYQPMPSRRFRFGVRWVLRN